MKPDPQVGQIWEDTLHKQLWLLLEEHPGRKFNWSMIRLGGSEVEHTNEVFFYSYHVNRVV